MNILRKSAWKLKNILLFHLMSIFYNFVNKIETIWAEKMEIGLFILGKKYKHIYAM